MEGTDGDQQHSNGFFVVPALEGEAIPERELGEAHQDRRCTLSEVGMTSFLVRVGAYLQRDRLDGFVNSTIAACLDTFQASWQRPVAFDSALDTCKATTVHLNMSAMKG